MQEEQMLQTPLQNAFFLLAQSSMWRQQSSLHAGHDSRNTINDQEDENLEEMFGERTTGQTWE